MKSKGKMKPQGRKADARGPNLKVVGLFAIALFCLTVILFYESAKPCALTVPDASDFQYELWMAFSNSQMSSFRMINVEQVMLLRGADPELLGGTLISLNRPQFDVHVTEVRRVVQVTYPFAERETTVNVLTLEPGTMHALSVKLESETKPVGSQSGVSIFSVQARAIPPSGTGGLTNAYVALAASDLYYVEGYAFSREKLEHMLELGITGDGAYIRTPPLMQSYTLLKEGLKDLVGFSIIEFREKSNGVKYVLKAVSVEGDQVTSKQVLVFETQEELGSNFNAAKTMFFGLNEKACLAGKYLVGIQPRPLSDLKKALQAL